MEVLTMNEVNQVSGGIVDDIVGGNGGNFSNGNNGGGGGGGGGGHESPLWLYYCFVCD